MAGVGGWAGKGLPLTTLAPQGRQPALRQARAPDHALRPERAAGGQAAGAGAGGPVGPGLSPHGKEAGGAEGRGRPSQGGTLTGSLAGPGFPHLLSEGPGTPEGSAHLPAYPQVLVEKRHGGRLCGLCGDFNGEQTNEFLSEDGRCGPGPRTPPPGGPAPLC